MALFGKKIDLSSSSSGGYTGVADVYELWYPHTRGNGVIGDKPSDALAQARVQIIHGNISIAASSVIENTIGDSGNDVIVVKPSDNRIDGGADNDVLYSDGDADILTGGAGNDIFVSAGKNDSICGFI
ncbi:M10 family metallopeptidase C-terminal domain-containing protein [Dickeya chrysanthemi]|uniref:M10 family metallopeptidase C-terminal domain-containing protein n=1 Tax=Dickeya chrysanthemi TaxID=556 RepID=UPI00039A8DF1|nr:M10 family metallopeptidase C-terminal domain-containing protein [Dickeya chrysanthemi]